jgi:flagellar M-ring protein FliF
MTAVLEGLKALGAARLGAMGAVALAVLGLLAFTALRGGAPMALLYGDLDLREAGQIVDQLDRAHIAHATEAGGARILVPADQVDQARLLLARTGLPSGGTVGYEIFDRADSLTATGFQQAIAQTRALEGELSRTIGLIEGVRSARVTLVLPQREPFARDRQPAQASVLLSMTGATRLDREGIQAILNLVAAAVPGLKPQNIAVVDNRGTLLARAGDGADGADGGAQSADEARRAAELRLSHAVEAMLERSLGAGSVRATAAVEMDYDQVKETQETFDPNGQVARSEQSVTEKRQSTDPAPQGVTVQNNLPNANAASIAGGSGSQEQRQDETTNYEIGKTVRTLVREQPQVKRISLAVMVDQARGVSADGKAEWHDRPPEELARIAALVRSAIGYDEKRGDKVEVVQMRFADADDAQGAAAPHGLFGLSLGHADLIRLVESGLVALVVVIGLLFVLRPMAVRLARPPVAALPGAAGAALAGPAGAPGAGLAGTASTGTALNGPDAVAALPGAAEDDAMIDLINVEGQLRASSLRRAAELVERYPNETLGIVRTWMEEAAP